MQFYLAPLQGYTEFPFRNAFMRHFGGLDKAISPFIASGLGTHIRMARIRDLWKEDNQLLAVDPQILGKEAKAIIPTANYLFDYGYDTLNLNMGCPIPGIRAKNRGAGLLAHPEMIESLLAELFHSIPNQISLKIRIGNENRADLEKIIPVMNQFPIKELIVHPRLGTQMYEGQVDLDAFAWCVQHAKAPLVYSGDIFDLDSFLRLKEQFPDISRWMLGRGLLFSPFLAEILRKESNAGLADSWNRFWDFHEDLKEQILSYSPQEKNQLNKLKEYWRYFSQAFQNSEKLFYRIAHAKDLKSFSNIMDQTRETAIWRAGLKHKESYRFMKD